VIGTALIVAACLGGCAILAIKLCVMRKIGEVENQLRKTAQRTDFLCD